MSFKSAKQARFLASRHPSVFKRFIKDSGDKIKVEKKAHKSRNRYTEALA